MPCSSREIIIRALRRLPPLPVLAGLAVTTVAAMALALAVGSVDIRPGEIAQALFGDRSSTAAAVVRDLRLPRAIAAFAVGGLLAVAGALMQVLLRNPL